MKPHVTRSHDINQEFLLLEKCAIRGEYDFHALEIFLVYLALFIKLHYNFRCTGTLYFHK